jgi:Family of unknown function (DUF5336)
MTYSYRGPEQDPTQSSNPYGGYWPYFTSSTDNRALPRRYPVWVVLVLGLATYVVSYGPVREPTGIEWAVRFSTGAAIVAALGLLPRQSAHPKLMVSLAVMGFLEALSRSITASGDQNPGWAMIVIVVLNALQAMAAIAELLAGIRLPATPDSAASIYDNYAYYAQAAQQFYAAHDQQPQSQALQASETAQAQAVGLAQAQQFAAERYAQYAEYLTAHEANPDPYPASSSQTGGFSQAAQHPAFGTHLPSTVRAEGFPRRPDAATGSPTQSS